jgi:hypothetical protein
MAVRRARTTLQHTVSYNRTPITMDNYICAHHVSRTLTGEVLQTPHTYSVLCEPVGPSKYILAQAHALPKDLSWQIGEQLFCMIIRAPDADTAASRADRPVTSSPHGVIAEEGNSFVLYDLGAEVCYHRKTILSLKESIVWNS